MITGQIVSIHIAPAAGEPTVPVTEVHAVPGKGLEGDRYFERTGTYSSKPKEGRELTLIESEAIEGIQREQGITLAGGDSRRNLVTRGVALNHLVGREFRVGNVTLLGAELCEPCMHLEGMTQPGVMRALVHRGGLRARILTEGTIRVGDKVSDSSDFPAETGVRSV